MSIAARLLAAPMLAVALLALFDVTSALGGLGPGELTMVLLVTLPVAIALYRAAAGVVTRTVQPEPAS